MVILMKNGSWYAVVGEREVLVREAYRTGAKRIDLYGDESVIVTSSGVDQLLSDEQFADMEHRKAHDWKCRWQNWHAKGQFCDHSDPKPEPVNLDYLREGEPKVEPTPIATRWFELMRLNNLKGKSGSYGTLRTLAELDQFEVDGIWPERVYQPRFRWETRRKPQHFPVDGAKAEYETVKVYEDQE